MHDSVTCVSFFCREVSIIIELIKIILKTNVDFLHNCLCKLALGLESDAKEFNKSVFSLLEQDRYIKNKHYSWQNFPGDTNAQLELRIEFSIVHPIHFDGYQAYFWGKADCWDKEVLGLFGRRMGRHLVVRDKFRKA